MVELTDAGEDTVRQATEAIDHAEDAPLVTLSPGIGSTRETCNAS